MKKDLPSLSGRTYLITDGAAGLGKELCPMLYSAGVTVYVASRSLHNIEDTIKVIIENPIPPSSGTPPPEIHKILPLILDLADLPSIKPSTEELKCRTKSIKVAFLNADVMRPPTGKDMKCNGVLTLLDISFYKDCFYLYSSPPHKKTAKRVSYGYPLTRADGLQDLTGSDGIASMMQTRASRACTRRVKPKILSLRLRRCEDMGNSIVVASLNPGHLKTELQRHINTHVVHIFRPGNPV